MVTHSIEDNASNNTSTAQPKIETLAGPVTAQPVGLSPLPYIVLGFIFAIGAAVAVNFTSALPPLVILGGAVGLLLAISVFQKPEWGAYILIFSVFTNLSDLFTEKGLPSINKPMVAIVVLSIFANYILRTGKIRSLPNFTRIEFWLGAYLLVILASSFVAIDQSASLQGLFDLLKDVAVGFCICFTLDTKDKVKTGLRVLLVALTFVSVLGVMRTITGTSNDFWGFAQLSAFNQVSDSDGQLRYGGPIGEANIWGQVLVSALPIILYILARERELLPKFLPAISGLLIVLAMFFTESRGAFLALVFILGLFVIDLRIKGPTFIVLVSVILLILFVLPAKYTQRIKSLDIFFQDTEYGLSQDESINGRRAKMLTGLAMFKSNPFLGVGFANYSNNYWSYAGNLGLDSSVLSVGEDEGDQNQPHSLYIEIMAETGIFGISSFAAFMGLILYNLMRFRHRNRHAKNQRDREWSLLTASIMMSLITFLIAGFFLHGIGFRFIWVLVGLALAFIYINQDQSVPGTTV